MRNDPRFQQFDAAKVPRFADVATFMRSRRVDLSKDLDIALVGVPFDMGVNFRTGARQGPAAVREASRIIRQYHPEFHTAPFRLCNVGDIGDAPVNALDAPKSIDMITDFFAELNANNTRPVAVGGDHTIPLPVLRGIAKKQPVGVVHFDAHPDTLDQLLGTKVNHATAFRRAVEEGLIDPKRMIQIGLRGSQFSEDDLAWSIQAGMRVVTFDEFEKIGREKVIQETLRVVGDGPVYITLDVDGIDPAYAIGTGVPEIGGLTPRDCQMIIRSLRGKDVVGGDICEVTPSLDISGHTAVTAANLMFEMLCVIAEAKAKLPNH
jgi:guanidinopropionase